MQIDHLRWMNLALDEARKAGEAGNRAIGSVVVRDGSVVGRGGNCRESAVDPTGHAEIMALRDAGKALGQYDLTGCTLYTTFEPCPMCCGAVIANDVSAVVVGGRHGPEDRRWGDYTVEKLLAMTGRDQKVSLTTGILAAECAAVLREWDERRGTGRG
jgi:tRNA(adenine34) deaminase